MSRITRTARITRKKTIPLLLSESKWAKEAISCIKELKLIKTRPIHKPRTQKDTESEQTTREKKEQTPEFEKFKRKKKMTDFEKLGSSFLT